MKGIGDLSADFDIILNGGIAGDGAKQCGFSIAFFADERNTLAGLNRKGKIMDQIGQILLMGEGEMFNIQHISPEKNNVRFRLQPERIACERNIGT